MVIIADSNIFTYLNSNKKTVEQIASSTQLSCCQILMEAVATTADKSARTS